MGYLTLHAQTLLWRNGSGNVLATRAFQDGENLFYDPRRKIRTFPGSPVISWGSLKALPSTGLCRLPVSTPTKYTRIRAPRVHLLCEPKNRSTLNRVPASREKVHASNLVPRPSCNLYLVFASMLK